MSRRARGTNWIGRHSFDNVTVTAGGTSTVELLDASDSSDEISQYLDPTLVRIRGHIVVDPEWSSDPLASTSKYYHTLICLAVGQTAFAIDDSTDLSSDRIIWTMLFSGAVHLHQDSTGWISVVDQVLRPAEVDCKAMRRFGDDMKLFMSIDNAVASDSVKVHYALRMLVKE